MTATQGAAKRWPPRLATPWQLQRTKLRHLGLGRRRRRRRCRRRFSCRCRLGGVRLRGARVACGRRLQSDVGLKRKIERALQRLHLLSLSQRLGEDGWLGWRWGCCGDCLGGGGWKWGTVQGRRDACTGWCRHARHTWLLEAAGGHAFSHEAVPRRIVGRGEGRRRRRHGYGEEWHAGPCAMPGRWGDGRVAGARGE
jgi:hypothetical protein